MWHVIVRDQTGAEVGGISLDEASGSISLGRSKVCHVRLNEPGISREHAYLYVSEGEVVVEDARSAIGTLVDGQKIDEPVYVGPGNVIQIGSYTVEVSPVEGDAAAPASFPDRSPATAMLPDDDPAWDDETVQPAAVRYQRSEAVPSVDLDVTLKPQAGPLKLVAVSGLAAGEEYPLTFEDDFDLGRDSGLEIPVTDPTVSRRHARLKRTDRGMMVIDLRSLNGTYVNGERVKRHEAEAGDRIRFGEVAFELLQAKASEVGEQPRGRLKFSRKQLILAGSGGMVVLGLLILGILSGGKPKREKTVRRQTQASVDSKLQRRFREKMGQARALMSKREWDKALEVLATTKDIFATHDDRDGLIKQANEEKHFKVILKKAIALYEAGGNVQNYQKSYQLFKQIRQHSDYYHEARVKLDLVRIWLANHWLTEGLSRSKARRKKRRLKAHKYLCRYFTLMPEYKQVGRSDERYREILASLEKKSKRYKEFEPCQAKRYLNPEAVGGASGTLDPVAELRTLYKLEPVVQVMLLYYKGKLDSAIDRLRKLKDQKKMRRQRVKLDQLFNTLARVKGKYSEGTGFIQSRKVNQAQKAFDIALTKDAKLIPPSLTSHVRTEIARLLAGEYLRLGQVEYDRSRYQDAYLYWRKGKQANPTHVAILNGLIKLKAVARNWIGEAVSLASAKKKTEARAKFEAVRRITEPGSRYYRQATTALSRLK